MTTLTFDQDLHTSKTHYNNINELIEELEDTTFGNIISQNTETATYDISWLRKKFLWK